MSQSQHVAKAFPSEKALNRYLEQHPKADKSKHHVESITDGQDRAKKERDKAKVKRDEGKLKDDLKKHKEEHPEGSINWNYDPKNRTKEQEEKADKATEKEARQLAQRFKAARQAQGLAQRFKAAGPMVIGPRGLQQPGGSQVTLQKGSAYWLGASSSPKMVILTDVTDDRLKYKIHPFTGPDITIERWIGADLIARGSATHLKQYGQYMEPELKHSLESLLRGGKGRKEDMDGYRPVTMELTPDTDLKGQDLWRAAEEYGGVGGREDEKEGYIYEVSTDKKRSEEAKKDPRFKVLKVTNRSGGGSDE